MSYVLILERIFIHALIPAFNHNRYQFPAFFFFQIQSWNIYFPPPPPLPIPSEFRYELYLDFRAHFIHAFNTAFNHNSHQFPAFFPSKFNLELCSPLLLPLPLPSEFGMSYISISKHILPMPFRFGFHQPSFPSKSRTGGPNWNFFKSTEATYV